MDYWIIGGLSVLCLIAASGWARARREVRMLRIEIVRLRVFSQRDPWQRSFTR